MLEKKKMTCFRLTKTAVAHLRSLKQQIIKETAVNLSYTDIVELLIRRANPDQLVKRINDV